MTTVQINQISPKDRIIVIMGPTGTGKSTFIDKATRSDGRSIGHSLAPRTAEINAVRCINVPGGPYVLVDTPGFDDTEKSDSEILDMIAEWLKKTYKSRKVKVSGIIYLHRISDNRMTASPLKNLSMFNSLCGSKTCRNIILATTMWSYVKHDVGERRQAELESDYWCGMLEMGSQTMRFENSFESAWDIIGKAVKQDMHALLLQEELVDRQLPLNKTEASKTLDMHISFEARQKSIRRRLESAKGAGNERLVQKLITEKKEMENKFNSTIKSSLWRRFLDFINPRNRPSKAG